MRDNFKNGPLYPTDDIYVNPNSLMLKANSSQNQLKGIAFKQSNSKINYAITKYEYRSWS